MIRGGAHGRPGPHDVDVVGKSLGQIGEVLAGSRADVFGRHEREPDLVVAGAQIVEQPRREVGLIGAELRPRRDVVEREHEPSDTGVEERDEFGEQRGAVVGIAVPDVEAGGEREAEARASLRARRRQLPEPCRFLVVVGLAPLGPVPGVVLRRVHVHVHPPLRKEGDGVEAGRMRPR